MNHRASRVLAGPLNFLAMVMAMAMTMAPALGATVQGLDIDDTAVVDGRELVLNGAGWRKRAYSKTDVVALYLEKPQGSIEEVVKRPGRKRILIRPLTDLTGATIARYFVADFTQAAQEAEFKTLINEAVRVGGLFGRLHSVRKGDVVTIDWLPGKGITAALNGVPLVFGESGEVFLNSDLMFQIILRMHLYVTATDELRMNLLGRSDSMRRAPAS